MLIDFARLDPGAVYLTLTQALIPRPIAWVLSENADGGHNLAPFSYFTAVSSSPPLIMLSVGRKTPAEPKDTAANIAARDAFVVHIPHREQIQAVNDSAAALPAGDSEVQRLGLRLAAIPDFPLPRLADARIALACRLYEIKAIGAAPQTLIFGEVQQLYASDAIAETTADGRTKIHADRLDPLGRLGAGEYQGFGEIMPLARPQ